MSGLRVRLAIGVAVLGAVVTTAVAVAGDHARLETRLTGYEEVPAISTTGNGTFRAAILRGHAIRYDLSYGALEGSVQQAHIHLGQRGVNGGITAYLCSNLGNGPAGTQPCPPPPAHVTGTITADQVVAGALAQGLEQGNLGELVDALRAGVAYANVHSSKWPSGEIRGQIGDGGRDHDR